MDDKRKNTCDLVKGSETVQLYVHDVEASLERPFKELKGFAKVTLEPGEVKTVTLQLDKRAFSYYDDKTKEWVSEPGEFIVLVGTSSQDIKLEKKITLK